VCHACPHEIGATCFCRYQNHRPSKCRHPNCRHKNDGITCMLIPNLEPILRLLNFQLQRRRCSKLERFYIRNFLLKTCHAISCAVNFYNAGVVTHGRRIGSRPDLLYVGLPLRGCQVGSDEVNNLSHFVDILPVGNLDADIGT
jgi:hypothetical protein